MLLTFAFIVFSIKLAKEDIIAATTKTPAEALRRPTRRGSARDRGLEEELRLDLRLATSLLTEQQRLKFTELKRPRVDLRYGSHCRGTDRGYNDDSLVTLHSTSIRVIAAIAKMRTKSNATRTTQAQQQSETATFPPSVPIDHELEMSEINGNNSESVVAWVNPMHSSPKQQHRSDVI
jgi:hypothetical protein